MASKYYTREEDDLLIQMVKDGATYSEISKALGRSLNSVMSRKSFLALRNGIQLPRVRSENRDLDHFGAENEPQIEMDDHSDEALVHVDGIDPIQLISDDIDSLNDQERHLLDDLRNVREERTEIFDRLSALMDMKAFPCATPLSNDDADETVDNQNTSVVSFRMDQKTCDLIKDYAYTKRMRIGDAVRLMVETFIENYKADPENEPLLKRGR